MSEAQARTAEALIIALCLLALFAIFQPFSLALFSIGCGLVVARRARLQPRALLPARPPGARPVEGGRSSSLIVFVVVLLLALGSAWLYGVYLQASGAESSSSLGSLSPSSSFATHQ